MGRSASDIARNAALGVPRHESSVPTGNSVNPRKRRIRDHYDRYAKSRTRWIERNGYFYSEQYRYLRFLVPEGKRVLELGCGTGELLAALKPSVGVGVDLSPEMVSAARAAHPEYQFYVGDVEDGELLGSLGGPFDVIVLSDTIGDLDDIETTFSRLHDLCTGDSRVIVVYHSPLWRPLLHLAERLNLKMPSTTENWLWLDDIQALLDLADFEIVRRDWWLMSPVRLFGLGPLLNRFVANLPILRTLCLRNYVVVRSRRHARPEVKSVSIIIPARNERGNIEPAVQRIPPFCGDLEIVFVEGNSRDGTLEEMKRVQAGYPERDIKVLVQDGKGKGDAVRKGFAAARGDVLMILDADLTVPPEDLTKFYNALVSGKGEFINGSRLVYPMQDGAMQLLNYLANHAFSILFTWLLNQRFSDTLCGSKVLLRRHYEQIAANRSYFGEFDPFGDFDLIFGATKANLKVVEVPICYASRTYGQTQISRFRHGLLLLRMVLFAYKKLKAFG